jgi:hypothetical protein
MNAYHYTLPRFLKTDRNTTGKIRQSWFVHAHGVVSFVIDVYTSLC